LDGDATAGDQLAAGATNGGGERPGPAVLVDEQGGRGAGLERGAGLRDVVVTEQARRGALEGADLLAEVGDLQRGDRAVLGLGDAIAAEPVWFRTFV
jgi:hypothetical protein